MHLRGKKLLWAVCLFALGCSESTHGDGEDLYDDPSILGDAAVDGAEGGPSGGQNTQAPPSVDQLITGVCLVLPDLCNGNLFADAGTGGRPPRDAGPGRGGDEDASVISDDAGLDDGGLDDAGADDAGDAGTDDAGFDDAGADAGLDDAGLDDDGGMDAAVDEDGGADAGLDDAGAVDGAVADAGDDAGAVDAALDAAP